MNFILSIWRKIRTLTNDAVRYWRYDNDYWKKKKHKRAMLKRILMLFIIMVLVFEAYTIAVKRYPWDTADQLVSNLKPGFKELITDFPLRIVAYINRYLYCRRPLLAREQAEKYLDHPAVADNIRNLIREDAKIDYSEVGGVVVLVKDGQQEYFRFIDIASDHTAFAQDFIRHKDDRDYLMKLFKTRGEVFRLMIYHKNEWLFDHMLELIDQGKDSEKLFNLLVEDFLFQCDNWYSLDSERLWQVFYPWSLPGRFIAKFHIHLCGLPSSDLDLADSQDIKEFVIVKTADGFILNYLAGGEIPEFVIERKFE